MADDFHREGSATFYLMEDVGQGRVEGASDESNVGHASLSHVPLLSSLRKNLCCEKVNSPLISDQINSQQWTWTPLTVTVTASKSSTVYVWCWCGEMATEIGDTMEGKRVWIDPNQSAGTHQEDASQKWKCCTRAWETCGVGSDLSRTGQEI